MKRKFNADIPDECYLARCQKRLKEWGAPLDGWYCLEIKDIREDDPEADLAVCELCGCDRVRFVHVMMNDLYFEPVEVGCICAGIMEGDILAAKERERLMRNRAARKRTFMKKEWGRTEHGWYLKYHHEEIRIGRRKSNPEQLGVKYQGRVLWTYKGKPITNFLSAVHASFNLVDPVEKMMRRKDA